MCCDAGQPHTCETALKLVDFFFNTSYSFQGCINLSSNIFTEAGYDFPDHFTEASYSFQDRVNLSFTETTYVFQDRSNILNLSSNAFTEASYSFQDRLNLSSNTFTEVGYIFQDRVNLSSRFFTEASFSIIESRLNRVEAIAKFIGDLSVEVLTMVSSFNLVVAHLREVRTDVAQFLVHAGEEFLAHAGEFVTDGAYEHEQPGHTQYAYERIESCILPLPRRHLVHYIVYYTFPQCRHYPQRPPKY